MFTKRVLQQLVMVAGLGLLSACGSDDDVVATPASIAWGPCTSNTEYDCGTLVVPVDYAAPKGEKITLGLRRRVADNADSNRILLLNPGGPGVSGLEAFNAELFPDRIKEEFTVIGFDPRGVGESNAVTCAELGFNDRDFLTTSEAGIRDYVDKATELAEKCFEKYGDYLQHLGTENVARDMEEIRKSAGAAKLDFLGFSYGSRLGAVYLQTFPESAGKFVLDALVSPVSTASVAAGAQTTAATVTLGVLLGGCTPSSANCNGTELVQRLENRFGFVLNALNNQELPPGVESFELMGAELNILSRIVSPAISSREFGLAARGPLLDFLEEFDLTPLVEFLSTLESEDAEQDADANQAANEPQVDETALIAIWCADDPERPTAESLIDLRPKLKARSDIFVNSRMELAAFCLGWKPALAPLAPIATSTAPDALLVGGTADHLTPIELLFEMQAAIGGFAITSDHIGHTIVYDDRSRCVDDQVTAFLVDAAAPTRLTCPVDAVGSVDE